MLEGITYRVLSRTASVVTRTSSSALHLASPLDSPCSTSDSDTSATASWSVRSAGGCSSSSLPSCALRLPGTAMQQYSHHVVWSSGLISPWQLQHHRGMAGARVVEVEEGDINQALSRLKYQVRQGLPLLMHLIQTNGTPNLSPQLSSLCICLCILCKRCLRHPLLKSVKAQCCFTSPDCYICMMIPRFSPLSRHVSAGLSPWAVMFPGC